MGKVGKEDLTYLLAGLDGNGRFIDADGLERKLSDGAGAAQMIVDGNMPELLFDHCEEMHDQLKKLGYYYLQNKLPNRQLQYVVYHDHPDKSLRIREVKFWVPHTLLPFGRILKGWGMSKDSPTLGANIVSKTMTPYAVNVTVPVNLPKDPLHPEFLDGGFTSEWLEGKDVPAGIWVNQISLKKDPIYAQRADVDIDLKVVALNERHAEAMAVNESLLNSVVAKFGCTRVTSVKPSIQVTPCVDEDATPLQDVSAQAAQAETSPAHRPRSC